MSSSKNQARFKKAVVLAKQIRKKNSKITYQEAIKLAFKKLPKTVGAAKKHTDTKSHNVNIRVVSGVKKKLGAVKIIQKGETKNSKVTKVLEQVRGKKGLFKGYKRIAGLYDKERELKSWTSVYSRLQGELLNEKDKKEKNKIRKEIAIAKSIISNLKKSKS